MVSKNNDIFRTVAESLRQYRRAELTDFAVGSNEDPVDVLYTDPLSNDAVLQTVLAPNTTFITGRKGTGKSTVFAKAQREIRKGGENISVYIDVKALYEAVSQNNETVITQNLPEKVNQAALNSHLLKKAFLGGILKELLSEVRKTSTSLNLIQKWMGQKAKYDNLMENLREIEAEVQNATLRTHELPILELISTHQKRHKGSSTKQSSSAKGSGSVKVKDVGIDISGEISRADEALSDEEIFEEYSKALLKAFPFNEIITAITNLLQNAGLKRFFVFFDDFSELDWVSQRLFVDVILAPLNNTSNERIKLKVAGYPGRIYYGKIDPGKVDEINLDFYNLYRTNRLPDVENSAVDYTQRLIEKRFSYYNVSFEDFLDSRDDPLDYYTLLFQATFNIPRVMGYILYYCYIERISKGLRLNKQAIRNASQRYYEDKMLSYFKLNRYALEPYNRKLDRYQQQALLGVIIGEANQLKQRIRAGLLPNALFIGLTDPPVSHFTVSTEMESLLASIELNLFLSKYHEMTDKDGRDISVFALNYGLCVREKLEWGYPHRQRYDKDYFKQRVFNYNAPLRRFLAHAQTIRCDSCGASHPMEDLAAIERFDWLCPDCHEGKCKVINLDNEFKQEIETLKKEIMVEPIEYEILQTLHDEGEPLRAKQISTLLDVTYQLVGKRTDKLQDMGYVEKKQIEGQKRSKLTNIAISTFFED
jgi:hypothetical protein